MTFEEAESATYPAYLLIWPLNEIVSTAATTSVGTDTNILGQDDCSEYGRLDGLQELSGSHGGLFNVILLPTFLLVHWACVFLN